MTDRANKSTISRVCVEILDRNNESYTENYAVVWPEKVRTNDRGWLIIEGSYFMSTSPQMWTLAEKAVTRMIPKERILGVEISNVSGELTERQIARLLSSC